MIDERIITLIDEIKEVKEENPTLEVQDVLRLFSIQATRDLTLNMRRLVNK